jgi:arylsulfatase A-like enzyme
LTRAFLRQLTASATASLAASLGEGLCAASRADTATSLDRALLVPWTLGLAALPGLPLAAALALLLAAACGEESLFEVSRRALRRPERRDAAAAWLAATTVLALVVFELSLSARRFRNAELASLGVAVAVTALGLGLGACALFATRSLRERRARGGSERGPWLVAGAVTAGALTWLLSRGATGLGQLDPRLVVAPLVFATVFLAMDALVLPRVPGRKMLAAALSLWLAGAGAWASDATRSAPALATHGAWSPPLIATLQSLSDWDSDGYSSFLGGGDCAPLDPRINPSAPEVPGDGVDNNCIGGDAGRASEPRRPVWGASVHGSPTNQNLVIVTIETLRHDHASFIGSVNDTTPNLRRLAGSSLVFERMYSAAPYTRLALASLFSSLAPSEIDWQPSAASKLARHISPKTPWLPELLSARGYDTIAVLTEFSAFTPLEDIGFERGFRTYDVRTALTYRGGTMWGFPAAEQVDKALAYVSRAKRPFFLWLHLFEPHYRYEQPPGAPVFGTDERARYDAEIWHVDAQVGRLLEGLRGLGVWDDTVLFLSGDHGEAFGEHDDRFHGTNLFEPQVRPAALLRVPGVTAKRVDVSVTFTDIAPTLARVLGDRTTFDQLRGRSLAPLMHHRALPPGQEGFVIETFNVGDGSAHQAAWVAYPLKLVYEAGKQRFSFYDLGQDPGERSPRDARSEPRAAPLFRELVGYLERARPRALGD